MLSTGMRALTALACALTLLTSCSSSTDTPTGEQTTIDDEAVARGIAEMSSLIPVCTQSAGAVAQASPTLTLVPESKLAAVFGLRQDPAFRTGLTIVSAYLGSTQPPDEFGECGGRITYSNYNHSNGITTATYSYENYCEEDSETLNRETIDGDISFVNNATPTQSGPITNSMTASSPGGITIIVRDAGGATLSHQRFTLTNFEYTVGVPGGSPTAANPNRFTADEIRIIDVVTDKSYRQTDYSSSSFNTTSGGEQMTVSGRGYRSSGGYFDLSTSSPIVSNSSGDIVSGQITFAGANNTNAILTLVSGPVLQGTMTVNGVPVTDVPACQ